MKEERCANCDDITGNAGKGDGSIYVVLQSEIFKENNGDEYGPLCESCYENLKHLEWIETD